jgi:outer membrane protein assembly factor BamA
MDMMWLVWSVFASMAAPVAARPSLQLVRFVGNHQVATAELQAAAQQIGAALSDDEGPERLVLAITRIYFDNGYVTARIDEPMLARDGALVIHVSEGARFYVRAISFSGAWPRAALQLRASLRTRAGEVFSRARVVADVERLASTVAGAVTPLTRLDVERHTVDLELALVP